MAAYTWESGFLRSLIGSQAFGPRGLALKKQPPKAGQLHMPSIYSLLGEHRTCAKKNDFTSNPKEVTIEARSWKGVGLGGRGGGVPLPGFSMILKAQSFAQAGESHPFFFGLIHFWV